MNRAENVGFEPTVPLGTTVFKTAAIDHSANSPGAKLLYFSKLTSVLLKKYKNTLIKWIILLIL